ncbi:FG-GAP-like repeat-containing protein [Flammeovirga pacifica]|uniref:Secretion system C-terminal sorting domain-containing protein n=1 Tax=Flammeovirga pacifica TaxID=915059 RepID=A0A1S1Z0Z3_FLAPC|nr:FG-GAP-like repeat-containing protein [Flammeovirga pacifica]OHX66944.1 hypothetical protein NH26_11610 [Flammeovirga pacifica]
MKSIHCKNSRLKRQLKQKITRLSTLSHCSTISEKEQKKTERGIKELATKIFNIKPSISLKKCITLLACYVGLNNAFAQSFEAPQTFQEYTGVTIFDAGTPSMYKPALVDIDNDGDLDLFLGTNPDLYFIENTGDKYLSDFSTPPEASPFGFKVPVEKPALEPSFVDIDDDGDYDLFVSIYEYGDMYYYENTGTPEQPQFAEKVQNAFEFEVTGEAGEYSTNASDFVDLDNDGDYDLLVIDYYGDSFYYENVGDKNTPQFDSPEKSAFGLPVFEIDEDGIIHSPIYEGTPVFNDIDNDGDQDLIVGSWNNDIQYFENTGSHCSPQFAAPITNPFGLTDLDNIRRESLSFGDLDGDGEQELVLCGTQHPQVYFYEFNGIEASTGGIGNCISDSGNESIKKEVQRTEGQTLNGDHFQFHAEYITDDASRYNSYNDRFGWEVATHKNTMAVGAVLDHFEKEDETIRQVGSVSIYNKDENGKWDFHQKLYAFDHLNPASEFGYRIEITDNFLFINANKGYIDNPGVSDGTRGFVYVYKKGEDGFWHEHQLISSSQNRSIYFGSKMGVSDNHMVIASAYHLFYYELNEATQLWEEAKVTEIDHLPRFIEMNEENFFIGNIDGLAIYQWDKDDWNNTYQLPIYNATHVDGDLDNNQFILGQYRNVANADSIKILSKNEDGHWNIDTHIQLPDNLTHSNYGRMVNIKDNKLIIASSSEYQNLLNGYRVQAIDILVYQKENNQWNPLQALVHEQAEGISPRLKIVLNDSSIFLGSSGDTRVTQYKIKEADTWEYKALSCEEIVWKDSVVTTPQTLLDTTAHGIHKLIVLGLPKITTDLLISSDTAYQYNNHLLEESGKYQITLENHVGCDSIINLDFYRTIPYTPASSCNDAVFVEKGFYEVEHRYSNLFFKYVAPADGELIVSTCQLTEEETMINIYSECGVFEEEFYYNCGDQAKINKTLLKGDTLLFSMDQAEVYDDYFFEVDFIKDCTPTTDSITVTSCDDIIFGDQNIVATGVYQHTFINQLGCDSTVILTYTKELAITEELDIETCSSYTFKDSLITQSGVYYDTLYSKNGCDSTYITLNLIIHENGSEFCGGNVEEDDDDDNITDIIHSSSIIEVYPNPFREHTILYFDTTPPSLLIEVYDLQGQKVLRKEYLHQNEIKINIPGPSGVYLIHIYSSDLLSPELKKVIKL